MVSGYNQKLIRLQEHTTDYMFVFDIDNTIVSEEGELDDDFFEIAAKMIDRDIKLTFATGRSYELCKIILDRVKTKLPIICFNGQVLCTSESILYKNVFLNKSKTLLEELKKDFYIFLEDTYEIVTPETKGTLFYNLEFGFPRKRIKVEPYINLFNPIRIYLRKKKILILKMKKLKN